MSFTVGAEQIHFKVLKHFSMFLPTPRRTKVTSSTAGGMRDTFLTTNLTRTVKAFFYMFFIYVKPKVGNISIIF